MLRKNHNLIRKRNRIRTTDLIHMTVISANSEISHESKIAFFSWHNYSLSASSHLFKKSIVKNDIYAILNILLSYQKFFSSGHRVLS